MSCSWPRLLWIILISGYWAAQTWPSSIDELEDVMFLGSGYKSRGFSSFVTPCSFSEQGPGCQAAAEWVQTAFHDMATADIYYANKGSVHGGIDASLAFELNSGENVGTGLHTSLETYARFFNSRLPMSDLIALGVYTSVRACGGPVIPMRGGRIDATEAGPLGVPQPQNGIGQFTNQFARMGFNKEEMIAMTACGHTLGGVHSENFEDIVVSGTVPNDFQLFDGTEEFDNKIATRYIHGPDVDPLSVGISARSKKDSDYRVFSSDNNVTIKAMTSPKTFDRMCVSILQRMIETVPPSVALSDVIEPYEVKPSGLQLTLLSGGQKLSFSGEIRVRTTTSKIARVKLFYKDRNGLAGKTPIDTKLAGSARGFDDSFSFYAFTADLPVLTSISSFNVLVTEAGGKAQTYDNNGKGFPVSDCIMVQTPQSFVNNGRLNVVAAVRASVTEPVKMTVTQKVLGNEGAPTPSPVPSLVSSAVSMVQGDTIGPYTLYSADLTISSAIGVKYGVTSGRFSDTFKDAADLGDTSKMMDTTPISSGFSHSYSYDTSTSSKHRSSSDSIPVTTAQAKPDQRKTNIMRLHWLFQPTISTEYTRTRPPAPACITMHRKGG